MATLLGGSGESLAMVEPRSEDTLVIHLHFGIVPPKSHLVPERVLRYNMCEAQNHVTLATDSMISLWCCSTSDVSTWTVEMSLRVLAEEL